MHFTPRIESLLGPCAIPPALHGQYRFAVATLKITKPAGETVSLAAADVTLHYYHGDETDVAPCEGLSWFKSDPGADVPMHMNMMSGPDHIRQITGSGTTGNTVVYIDAVFTLMEPDTKECWICLARPTTTEPFVCPSPAWTAADRVPEMPGRVLLLTS